MRTAIAYVDGFNFYYGVVRDTPGAKWLDFQRLSERLLRRGYDVVAVRYYTAKVIDFPDDPSQSQRQNTYLRALATRPKVQIVLGQFQINRKPVRLVDGTRATAVVPEEKGSDVNLGTDLSWDAAQGRMDTALVMSNDFDLQHPIQRAIDAGIEVIVVNPHGRRGRHPAVRGTDVRRLNGNLLRQCQLPEQVLSLDGDTLLRPAAWRAVP